MLDETSELFKVMIRMSMQYRIIGLAALMFISLVVTFKFCAKSMDEKMISECITSVENVKDLFPHTPQEIKNQKEECLKQAARDIESLLVIPPLQRTFANTVQALDVLASRSNMAVKDAVFEVIQLLHPDKAMRDAAHDAIQEMKDFYVDNISNNKKLYESFKAYAEGNSLQESLNKQERYFIDETMKGFKRAGLDLPDDKLQEVRELKKKLSKTIQQFDRNIADDQSSITAKAADLAGLDPAFIAALKKNDAGDYVLGVDYPTYHQVLENCIVEDTRKRLYEAFSNRAYPVNHAVLQEVIALRDQLAQKLGYVSYADLDLDNQMVKSPERARHFLDDLIAKSQQKEDQEFNTFAKELPSSVTLTKDGKIKAWDLAHIKTQYKQKHFNVDERVISEYFPMQQTIEALLDIYHQFMGVSFQEEPIAGMWHEDVRLIKVLGNDKKMLGYLFLDLYPRPNKYSHAAHAGMVPAIKTKNGSRLPAVSVVIANFPKPTEGKPALLMRADVRTFFHEFGHALHALLGATELGSSAGTSTKTDFVELPSQMLEEWLWDKEILQKVSKHYVTGKPLSDEIIKNIIALKNYDSGNFVQTQAVYSLLSLDMYKVGASKDPFVVLTALQDRYRPRIAYGPNNHMYASFGHLTGYGAKYYGYLWSKVFALDLFDTIKKHGLLNPVIGKQYVDKVIGKGGSEDPNDLLKDFLGREPNQNAFLRDLGLNK